MDIEGDETKDMQQLYHFASSFLSVDLTLLDLPFFGSFDFSFLENKTK